MASSQIDSRAALLRASFGLSLGVSLKNTRRARASALAACAGNMPSSVGSSSSSTRDSSTIEGLGDQGYSS